MFITRRRVQADGTRLGLTAVLLAMAMLASSLQAPAAHATHAGDPEFLVTYDWYNERESYWPGEKIRHDTAARISEGDITYKWEVSGPCNFYDSRTVTVHLSFSGRWTFWWKRIIQPNACVGLYTVTFTLSHTATGESSISDTYLVDPDAPPGGIPPWQTYGSGFSPHGPNGGGMFGDPVNTGSGSYTAQVSDLKVHGIGIPFGFTRTYNSGDDTIGPLGRGWTHSYGLTLTDQGNGDILFRGEDGQRFLFVLQPDGTFLRPRGAWSKLASTASGYELTRRDQVVYAFDAAGRLDSITDRNGNTIALTYDASGNLSQLTDSAGRVFSLVSDAAGFLQRIDAPDGRSVSFSVQDGLLASVTDTRGGVWSYGYDPAGLLTSITSPSGEVILQNAYGPDGRIIEQADAEANTTTFSWDPTTETATIIDPRGDAWTDTYSESVLIKRADPLGNVTKFSYDDDLNTRVATDPRGNAWSFTYDQAGNLTLRSTPADSNFEAFKEEYFYDAQNNLTHYVDPRGSGAVTAYEYDAAGNRIKMTQPGGLMTLFTRDPAGTGLLTGLTDPEGNTTTFEYDSAGNRVAVVLPGGARTELGYDQAGRIIARTDPRGTVAGANAADFTWTFVHDEADNLVQTVDPLGNTTAWTFDGAGRLASRADPRNSVTTYGYDGNSRLVQVLAPDGTLTTYGYDGNGNLSSRTDTLGATTSYAHDGANRLIEIVDPLGNSTTFSYDANGNLTSVVDGNGNSTPGDPSDGKATYTYDTWDRLTRITYSDSTPTVSFTYDKAGNRTAMSDGSGTTTFTYDGLSRLTGVTKGSDTFSYTLSGTGNVEQSVFPDGTTTVDYAYNPDGLMSSVTVNGGAVATYSYDEAGNLATVDYPTANGYRQNRTYDGAGRLTGVSNERDGVPLSSFAYTLDPGGLPTQMQTIDGTNTFTYDPNGRLTEFCTTTSCTEPDSFIRYSYDGVGNRLSEVRSAGTTTYSYNLGSQLLGQDGPAGSVSYSYDKNGNMLSAGQATYTYDLANRLASAKIGRTTTEYAYDGDGRRASSTSGNKAANARKYVWDQAPLPLLALERDGNGAQLRRYVYGLDLVSFASGGQEYFYHHDGLGSVSNVTDASGGLQWTYTYEPFGALTSETEGGSRGGGGKKSAAPFNPMRYAGEFFDSATDLYHLRAREYDPGTGRFLRTDPANPRIVDPFVSPYVYVKNSPTLYVDPSGEVGLLGAIVGAVSGAVGALVQGGSVTDMALGAATGAVLGFAAGPLASRLGGRLVGHVASGAASGFVGDISGQVIGARGLGNVNWCAAGVAAGAGGLAGGIARVGSALTHAARAAGAGAEVDALAEVAFNFNGFSVLPGALGPPALCGRNTGGPQTMHPVGFAGQMAKY